MSGGRWIPLRGANGVVLAWAIVDDDLWERLSAHRWYLSPQGYAVRSGSRSNGVRGKTLRLHREVMRLSGRPVRRKHTDHINGDKLDNRRRNLRSAHPWQNHANQRRPKNNTSGFKGVSWHSIGKRWAAEITCRRKRHRLGLFKTKEAAHAAYCTAAKLLAGDFARFA